MITQHHFWQFKRPKRKDYQKEMTPKKNQMRLLLFVSASQCQAASQKAMDQMNAAHEASLSSQFHQKIQEMEEELDRVRTSQQDSFIHRESMHKELQW